MGDTPIWGPGLSHMATGGGWGGCWDLFEPFEPPVGQLVLFRIQFLSYCHNEKPTCALCPYARGQAAGDRGGGGVRPPGIVGGGGGSSKLETFITRHGYVRFR